MPTCTTIALQDPPRNEEGQKRENDALGRGEDAAIALLQKMLAIRRLNRELKLAN
jgi:hypothetical protein